MTLVTEWEQAAESEFPILWYLCYDSSLPVFKTRQKATKAQIDDMFSELEADIVEGEVPTGERVYFRMRLPYTEVMIERRRDRLGK